MTKFQRILCPVDFSDTSRHALDYAMAMARASGGTVTVLHVLEPLSYGADPMVATAFSYAADDIARVREQLDDFVREEVGTTVRLEVVENNAVDAILGLASSMPADLLVLGTHGRRGFERFMLGSVTERVLRKAACPVLTVPPRVPEAMPLGSVVFHRLLCAVDFSSSSLQALELAATLVRETGAALTALSVLEPIPPALDPWTVAGGVLQDWSDTALTATRARLHEVIPKDVPATEDAVIGKPYREILARAEQEHADLIVIGVHSGRGPIPGFFGSTTNHVVREAACPVLSVRD